MQDTKVFVRSIQESEFLHIPSIEKHHEDPKIPHVQDVQQGLNIPSHLVVRLKKSVCVEACTCCFSVVSCTAVHVHYFKQQLLFCIRVHLFPILSQAVYASCPSLEGNTKEPLGEMLSTVFEDISGTFSSKEAFPHGIDHVDSVFASQLSEILRYLEQKNEQLFGKGGYVLPSHSSPQLLFRCGVFSGVSVAKSFHKYFSAIQNSTASHIYETPAVVHPERYDVSFLYSMHKNIEISTASNFIPQTKLVCFENDQFIHTLHPDLEEETPLIHVRSMHSSLKLPVLAPYPGQVANGMWKTAISRALPHITDISFINVCAFYSNLFECLYHTFPTLLQEL